MGSWSKWWAGELMVLITNYCRKSTLLGELLIYLFILSFLYVSRCGMNTEQIMILISFC